MDTTPSTDGTRPNEYRGCFIDQIRHNGFYETYAGGRFVKADTLEGIRGMIDELEHGDTSADYARTGWNA